MVRLGWLLSWGSKWLIMVVSKRYILEELFAFSALLVLSCISLCISKHIYMICYIVIFLYDYFNGSFVFFIFKRSARMLLYWPILKLHIQGYLEYIFCRM